ncbi:MAG TPA: TetR/AcrR family transcriptional regulator [Ramlibacter sp.]|nr:TetR/AcrR family transcriptional regulator [Ramlibacter sp.]
MARTASASNPVRNATAATETASPVGPADRRPVRERLLAAADELFYREGINKVGIDRVLEHAGVAKASLYSTFGSKEELVCAYLEGRQQARRARIEAAMARHRGPREQMLAVFDAMADVFAQPGFRGCAFLMASAELPAGERTRPICDEYRSWIRELFQRLAKEAGARQATALAQQLVMLYDGALVAAQMDGNAAAARTARAMATSLIDAAVGRRS